MYHKGVGGPGLSRYLKEANSEVEVWLQVRGCVALHLLQMGIPTCVQFGGLVPVAIWQTAAGTILVLYILVRRNLFCTLAAATSWQSVSLVLTVVCGIGCVPLSVCHQVETKSCFESMDEVLSVPGITSAFLGESRAKSVSTSTHKSGPRCKPCNNYTWSGIAGLPQGVSPNLAVELLLVSLRLICA